MKRDQEIKDRKLAEQRARKLNEWWQNKKRDAQKSALYVPKKVVACERADPAETESNFRAWLSKKIQLKANEKCRQAMCALTKEEKGRDAMRNKLEKNHKEWLRSARNKSKPVPLNKGFLSIITFSALFYTNF